MMAAILAGHMRPSFRERSRGGKGTLESIKNVEMSVSSLSQGIEATEKGE